MSLNILFDNASFMHTKDLTDISNFPSKNSVPEIHKMGGVSPPLVKVEPRRAHLFWPLP